MEWIPASDDLAVKCKDAAPNLEPYLAEEGQLFCWETLTPHFIEGCFVPYSWYVAKKGIKPLAVTGICQCGESVLLGKRAADVTTYPGYWEFVPAGGISSLTVSKANVDYRRQVLEELDEECGTGNVDGMSVLGLLKDGDGLVDIVLRLQFSHRFKPRSKTGEVVAFEWVAREDLPSFFEKNAPVIPLASYLVNILGLP